MEKRLLGQSLLLFNLRTSSIMGKSSAQIIFVDVDWKEIIATLQRTDFSRAKSKVLQQARCSPAGGRPPGNGIT
jgi:hypothetical protein